ncbi:hypothetical protein RHMOL_Rhmol06G0074800 [Rhododendron molle]|uniref:Uncharacterized protein n=1 Tax=Rhododendron molle TaxID=49168 RepID=A0ACC0NB87_RHOML|nr:hypothetical protein RHMOL_Rhmol06G0074800 [Rhododendron molle]
MIVSTQQVMAMMNPRAFFGWLMVFLHRHRVRPTVAMACGVKAIILRLTIEQQHTRDSDFIKALKIISISLTVYNALFTLVKPIEMIFNASIKLGSLGWCYSIADHKMIASTQQVMAMVSWTQCRRRKTTNHQKHALG